jgi:hypothetical protein
MQTNTKVRVGFALAHSIVYPVKIRRAVWHECCVQQRNGSIYEGGDKQDETKNSFEISHLYRPLLSDTIIKSGLLPVWLTHA